MSQVILGVGGYTTDASACLLVDGEVVAAASEERFTRVKHQGGWPTHAVAYCLKTAGLDERQIDHIGFSYDPWLRLSRRLPFRAGLLPRHPIVSSTLIMEETRFVAGFKLLLRDMGRRCGAKVHTLRHHLCHAASSFLSGPYDESAIYTFDMRGEWDTAVLAKGHGSEIEVLEASTYPDSLGIFYAGLTHFLGFGPGDEFKVMGLASYGEPRFTHELSQILHPAGPGEFRLERKFLRYHITRGYFDKAFFSEAFHELLGPSRDPKTEPVTQRHMDLAASGQRVFEDCALHQINHLHTLVPSRNLCVAGGCGLNGVLNGRIYTDTPFEHVFLPSAAGDDGLSLGAALLVWCQKLGNPRPAPLLRADLGPEYSDEEIRRCLDLFKLDYEHHEDVIPRAAELVAGGAIVGWFQGRMEFGARALGNRSILANPTLPDMKDKINASVKFREEFRPFAPSVISEAAERYFVLKDPIPFMTVVTEVKPEARELLAAVTHVDDTARVQTVSREHAPRYWELISAVGERTGTPVVLNTSFNVMGEPIVERPEHAIRCFYSCGMDALVIGNYVLTKPRAGAE